MAQVKAAAKQHSIAVVLGFAEQSPSYSVYISQAIISPQGELLLHRHKISPLTWSAPSLARDRAAT
jgi:predicted amidohydrolase